MGNGYSGQGVLNDTYGYFYAGGQRFSAWTDDAFNPTAWGVATRVLPSSAPELLTGATPNIGGGQGGFQNMMANVSPWNVIKSPVVWIIVAVVVLIPLYHKLEYGK